MIARFYCHRVSKSTNVFFWKISNLARNQIRLRNTMIIEIEQIDSIYVKANNLIDRTFVWQRIGRVNFFVIERKAKKKKDCEREKGDTWKGKNVTSMAQRDNEKSYFFRTNRGYKLSSN